MSGICGIVSLDGRPIGEDEIRQMALVLERRGPDGTHVRVSESVALGHTLLATTPEALVEQLPFTHEETGCTITADIRLDNRDELIAALDLSTAGRVIGDGELVLLAWLKWGEACCAYLLGDFAFAIWDPRVRRLFCARDQLGMRQLVYCHIPGQLFVFATEPRAVLAHPRVDGRLNEQRTADYLAELEAIDPCSTFFDCLYRLPPAHSLRLDEGGLQVSRYWSLQPRPALMLESDAAYEEAFLEVFAQAVHCRLRSAGKVGAMLSGGLDSGAVVAVAARMLAEEGRGPLTTISANGPDAESCRETRLARLTAAMPGLDPRFVSYGDVESWGSAVLQLTRESDEPFDGHMTLPRAVYWTAHEAGLKVVLDGGGGDTLFLPGSWIARLLRQGRWREAFHEIGARRSFWSDETPIGTLVLSELRKAFIPSWLRQIRRSMRSATKSAPTIGKGLIKAELAARTDLDARRQAFERLLPHPGLTYPEERVRITTHPSLVVGRERYDRVASALAIEPRDPFLDRRVLEFCASLPGEQLAANGWPKLLLRRVMKNYLPDEVRWQRGKHHLGLEFTRQLALQFAGQWRSSVTARQELLRDYTGSDALKRLLMEGEAAFDREELHSIWFLALWLERFGSELER